MSSSLEVIKHFHAFTHLGCFTDNSDGLRALSGLAYADNAMTVASCATFCAPYNYFGVEYGRECYCGDLQDPASTQTDQGDCSFPCAGNDSETCGASNRLDVYTNNLYVSPEPADIPYLGCFVDTWARVLPDGIISTDDMTGAACAANCAGYNYFGTEWSRECYCGNTAPTDVAPDSDCSFTCTGDDQELCGGSLRLTVYGPMLPAGPIVTPGPTPTPPIAPTTVSPSDPLSISNFVYRGCFTDSDAARVLTGSTQFDPAMTVEMCAVTCAGYTWFGVEYASQCFCGIALDSSSIQSPESDCDMACGGNPDETCGGPNRLNVYNNPTSAAPVTKGLSQVGAFTYQSCWTDSVNARSLTGATYRSDDMTVESCAAFCQGYNYFGVEYARECYCDNAPTGEAAPEADCSQLCMGDDAEWCGGPDRLNLYTALTQVNITPEKRLTRRQRRHQQPEVQPQHRQV